MTLPDRLGSQSPVTDALFTLRLAETVVAEDRYLHDVCDFWDQTCAQPGSGC